MISSAVQKFEPNGIEPKYQYEDEDIAALSNLYCLKLLNEDKLWVRDIVTGQYVRVKTREGLDKTVNNKTTFLYYSKGPTDLNLAAPLVIFDGQSLQYFLDSTKNSLLKFCFYNTESWPTSFKSVGVVSLNPNGGHWVSINFDIILKPEETINLFSALGTAIKKVASDFNFDRLHEEQLRTVVKNPDIQKIIKNITRYSEITCYDSAYIRSSNKLYEGVSKYFGNLNADSVSYAQALRQDDSTSCGVFALFHQYEALLLGKKPKQAQQDLLKEKNSSNFANAIRSKHIDMLNIANWTFIVGGKNILFSEKQAMGKASYDLGANRLYQWLQNKEYHKFSFFNTKFEEQVFKILLAKSIIKNGATQNKLEFILGGVPLFFSGTHPFHISKNITNVLRSDIKSSLDKEQWENLHGKLIEYVIFHWYHRSWTWGREKTLPKQIKMAAIIKINGQYSPVIMTLQLSDEDNSIYSNTDNRQTFKDQYDKLERLFKRYYSIEYHVAVYEENSVQEVSGDKNPEQKIKLERLYALDVLFKMLNSDLSSLVSSKSLIDSKLASNSYVTSYASIKQLSLQVDRLEEPQIQHFTWIMAAIFSIVAILFSAISLLTTFSIITLPSLWKITTFLATLPLLNLMVIGVIGLLSLGLAVWNYKLLSETASCDIVVNDRSVDLMAIQYLVGVGVLFVAVGLIALLTLFSLSSIWAIAIAGMGVFCITMAHAEYADNRYNRMMQTERNKEDNLPDKNHINKDDLVELRMVIEHKCFVNTETPSIGESSGLSSSEEESPRTPNPGVTSSSLSSVLDGGLHRSHSCPLFTAAVGFHGSDSSEDVIFLDSDLDSSGSDVDASDSTNVVASSLFV